MLVRLLDAFVWRSHGKSLRSASYTTLTQPQIDKTQTSWDLPMFKA